MGIMDVSTGRCDHVKVSYPLLNSLQNKCRCMFKLFFLFHSNNLVSTKKSREEDWIDVQTAVDFSSWCNISSLKM